MLGYNAFCTTMPGMGAGIARIGPAGGLGTRSRPGASLAALTKPIKRGAARGARMATHGSLTKAGKVRSQTPKVEGRKRAGTNSKLRNKSNYHKRFELVPGRYPGQNKPGQRRRRR